MSNGEIDGTYKVKSKSTTGINFEGIGWVSLPKELQENTLQHIVEGQQCQIKGYKSEGYKYPMVNVLIPIDENQTFLDGNGNKSEDVVKEIAESTVQQKPTQEYWDKKQDLITKEWAYGQSKDLVLGLARLNNNKVIPDAELQQEIIKWAGWFYQQVKM